MGVKEMSFLSLTDLFNIQKIVLIKVADSCIVPVRRIIDPLSDYVFLIYKNDKK